MKVKRYHECPECHKILPYLRSKCDCGYRFSGASAERQFKTCTACGSLVPVSQLFCACGKFLPLQKDAITEADVETAYQNGLFAGIAEERERNEKEWACFFADAGLKDTFTNKAIANREDFYAWKKSFDEDCLRRARAAAQSKFEHLAENMTAAMKIREKTLDFIKKYNVLVGEQILACHLATHPRGEDVDPPDGVNPWVFEQLCDYYSAEVSVYKGIPAALSSYDVSFYLTVEYANYLRKIFSCPNQRYVCDDGYFIAVGALTAVSEVFLKTPRSDSIRIMSEISLLCTASKEDAAIVDDNMKIAADEMFLAYSRKAPNALSELSFSLQELMSDEPNAEKSFSIAQVFSDYIKGYVSRCEAAGIRKK